MARRVMEIGLALALVSMLFAHVSAQSGCTTVILSLAPCLNYITGNSSTPSSSCCSQLASVVQSQPRCLCTLLNGGASSLGITINQTLALALPGACKVQTPPVSQCNAVAGGPAASPPKASSTPATPSTPPANPSPETPSTPSVPSSTPATASTPSESGSKTVPSATGESSHGSSNKSSRSLLISFLLLAAYVSLFSL
ncbi:non-specific lipid transfer protein GPI-anchored 15 [Elaeis guineensis]|uniref:Non-specific lipid-transfer protein-like protein At2g13820 n=1 Tax=Elaeis guineensis var. tenera TaxID=51953 RepID=A0A6I9S5P9_ELAGV|nr:non-specific lipid-transfer protein-like protein At2g13820 [Elaeis guineensis]